MLGDELVVGEMRIGTADAIDFRLLAGAEDFMRIQTDVKDPTAEELILES